MHRRALLRPFALSLLLLSGCDGGSSPIDPGQDDPPDGDPNREVGTVTASGGTVALDDGTAVVFPAGAVGSSLNVTLEKMSPSTWIDGESEYEGVVVSTTAAITQFQQEVEIRVPLPAATTPADSSAALVGLVEEATGALTVEHHTIEMIDGKPFLVLETDHFSKRFFQWLLGEDPPASAGPLAVPYYNQGESPYCWATSVHMVTQAAGFQDTRSIAEIIGKMGVDESGITAASFRWSSTLADLVRSRTGVRPLRQVWDYVNANLMRDYLWREIGVNGRPVAAFLGQRNHAVVFVGYDGSTFYIHDPASTTTSSIGYTTQTWTQILNGMGATHNMVTLAVPKDLPAGDGPVRVNVLPRAVKFTKPRVGSDPPAVYEFHWDFTLQDGYSFQHVTARTVQEPFPGAVTTVSVPGEIQISNASRTQSREVSVWLDITGLGAPAGSAKYSTQKTITVGPNAVANFKPDPIPVDTFRYNVGTTTEYLFAVSAFVDGARVDRQAVEFRIESVTPEITAVVPGTAGEGEVVKIQGIGFGAMAFKNAVLFNGAQATDIVSWADDEIQVKVPAEAASGPVEVKRGEVSSNTVDFTVAEYTTLTFTLNHVNNGEAIDGVTVTASGSWSLRGEGAILDFSNDDYYSLETRMGVPATLSFSVSASASPTQITQNTQTGGTAVYQLKAPQLEVQWGSSGGFSVSESGSGGNTSLTFTFSQAAQWLGPTLSWGVSADVYEYDSDGVLVDVRPDVYLNGRTALVLYIEPLFGG